MTHVDSTYLETENSPRNLVKMRNSELLKIFYHSSSIEEKVTLYEF